MKKTLLFYLTIFLGSQILLAQTTLSAGDIAITGYNADGGDQFAFLLLHDIDANTVIKFTDRGWAAGDVFYTSSGTEGVAEWSHTSALTCGTEIVVSATNATASSATIGTTTGGFDFATSGDEILVYQGLDATPTFITAYKAESTAWEPDATNINDSRLPTGLVDGSTAFLLSPEADNARYLCTTTSGTAAAVRTQIYVNSGTSGQNWESNSSAGYALANCSWSITCPVLSVNDNTLAKTFSMFPNPLNKDGFLNIRNNSQTPITSVEVYDIVGKKIFTETANTNKIHFDNSTPSGVYFVKIIDAKNNSVTKKVMLQ